MKKYFVLICCAVVMFACSKKSVPTSTTQTTTTTTVTADASSIAQGKQIVAAHCVKCHKEPIPAEHSKEKWDKVLPAMFGKAHIDDLAQQQLIRDYVYSNLN